MKNNSYKLYWFCELLSAFGGRIQSAGIIWYIYAKTNSVWVLGGLAVIETLPSLLFYLKAGVIAEKYKDKPLYLYSNMINVLISILLFICVAMGNIILLMPLLFLQNTFAVLSSPAKNSFMFSIISKEERKDSIRRNGLIGNLAKVLGPPIAGVVLYVMPAQLCFLMNAVSYLPFILAYRYFKVINKDATEIKGKELNLKASITYLKAKKEIVNILAMLLISCFFLFNYNIIIPVIATDILKLNSLDFSLIYTVNGLGNIVGNYILKRCDNYNHSKKRLLQFIVGIIVIYICISQSHNYMLTLALFFLTGAVNSMYQIISSSGIQTTTDEEYRGRVTGIYQFACSGLAPLARIVITTLIAIFGASTGLLLQGIIALVVLLITFNYLKE